MSRARNTQRDKRQALEGVERRKSETAPPSIIAECDVIRARSDLLERRASHHQGPKR